MLRPVQKSWLQLSRGETSQPNFEWLVIYESTVYRGGAVTIQSLVSRISVGPNIRLPFSLMDASGMDVRNLSALPKVTWLFG